MSPTPTISPLREAELYLEALTQHAPSYGLLDIRYRIRGPQLARLFLASTQPKYAAQILLRIGQHTDVYVGIAPRRRRRGTRQDLTLTALLWADCDTPGAIERLNGFPIQPSMVIASGTPDHVHAYWQLTRPLPIEELEQANRALAHALAADLSCADATRILRPPGTRNLKHRHPQPVRLLRYSAQNYEPSRLLEVLPTPPTTCRAAAPRPRASQDPLLHIPPAQYVEALLGVQIPRSRKIRCPFHDDTTPSFHVYRTPEQGWACFGCKTPNGKPLGGDLYTLASRLWLSGQSRDGRLRGREFIEVRQRLLAIFFGEVAGVGG